MFACPVCGLSLMPRAGSSDSAAWAGARPGALVCAAGHSFDVAKQGYVSLVTGDSHIVGDTSDMVQARASFLATGVYEPIVSALVEMLASFDGRLPVGEERAMSESVGIRPLTFADLGGGTGYYSASILDALPAWDGVLLDVSKHAAKLAARAHRRLKVATADLRTTIPLITASMDAALVVFAPRNAAEIRRILAPGGVCVVVTPTERHLQELRATQHMLDIDPDKEDRLTRQFADFNLMEQRQIEWQTDLTQQQVQWVVGMGPSAFHTESTDRASHIQDPVNTTVSVTVRAFQPK